MSTHVCNILITLPGDPTLPGIVDLKDCVATASEQRNEVPTPDYKKARLNGLGYVVVYTRGTYLCLFGYVAFATCVLITPYLSDKQCTI